MSERIVARTLFNAGNYSTADAPAGVLFGCPGCRRTDAVGARIRTVSCWDVVGWTVDGRPKWLGEDFGGNPNDAEVTGYECGYCGMDFDAPIRIAAPTHRDSEGREG